MKAIETPAVINSFRSKIDKSLSFTAETPELTTTERANFMDLQGVNVKLLIVPQDTGPLETLKIDKEVNSKTASQRLRAVLFILWKQRGENGDFEEFYRIEMESLISYFKDKLDN